MLYPKIIVSDAEYAAIATKATVSTIRYLQYLLHLGVHQHAAQLLVRQYLLHALLLVFFTQDGRGF